MILGYLHPSLSLMVLVSKLGVVCPTDLSVTWSDEITAKEELWVRGPCGSVGENVVNDLLITHARDLGISFKFQASAFPSTRERLWPHCITWCGFLFGLFCFCFLILKLCSNGLHDTALICLFMLYLFLRILLIFPAMSFFREMHFLKGVCSLPWDPVRSRLQIYFSHWITILLKEILDSFPSSLISRCHEKAED